MKNKLFLAVILLAVLSVPGCIHDFSQTPAENEVRELTALEKKLVQTDETFSWKLFREINKTESGGNIFISPLSTGMALAMTYNGASGETEAAMRSTLEFGDLSQKEIDQTFKSLIKLLTQIDPRVQFQIANSIWYQQGFNVTEQFIDLNKTYFGAAIKELDLYAPGVLDMINGWVGAKTNGKIPDLLDRIDPLTVMLLINAIYFNGMWTYEFDKNKTVARVFYPDSCSQVTCDMMQQRGEFFYTANDNYQAIDLAYGSGKYSMTILLPQPDVKLAAFIAGLDAGKFAQIIGNLTERKGNLVLPKFQLKYKLELNEVLKALGMGIAFDPFKADFSAMCNSTRGNLYIDKVIHQTYVKVDEEGTEAAAATVVVIKGRGGSSGFEMVVNRPFLFLIRARKSNVILFMGRVVNPVLD